MPMRARTFVLLALVPVGAVSAVLALHRGEPAEREVSGAPSKTAGAPSAFAANPGANSAGGLAPERGRTYRVALDVRTAPGAGASAAKVRVTGELRALAAAADEQGGQRIQLVLTGSAVAGEDGVPYPMPGLGEPTDAYFDARGRLVSIAVADGMTPAARNTLATVAASLQLVGGRGDHWEAEEADAIGAYRTRYERTSRGVHKQKVAYQSLAGRTDRPVTATVKQSGTEVLLGADGWPDDVTLAESIGFSTAGAPGSDAHLDVMTELHLASIGAVDTGAPPPIPRASPIRITDLGRDPAAELAADREMVDGASLSDLLATYGAVRGDQHAEGYQYLRMAALFRIDPAAAADAGARIRAGADREQTQLLAGALGSAGAPAAQHALSGLARDPGLDEGTRAQAVIALGLSANPTEEALAALRAVVRGPAGDLREGALLAMGNLALRLRSTDPAGAAAIVDELVGLLATAASDAERASVIRALGNTGDERIVGVIAAHLRADDWTIRAAVYWSLRQIPTADAARLLVGGLSDPGSGVRAAAVSATANQPQASFIAPLLALYRREPVADVRRQILEVAAMHASTVAEYVRLLEAAARTEADPELAKLAAAALAGA